MAEECDIEECDIEVVIHNFMLNVKYNVYGERERRETLLAVNNVFAELPIRQPPNTYLWTTPNTDLRMPPNP